MKDYQKIIRLTEIDKIIISKYSDENQIVVNESYISFRNIIEHPNTDKYDEIAQLKKLKPDDE